MAFDHEDAHLKMVVYSAEMSEEAKQYVQTRKKIVREHFREVETEHMDVKINLLHQILMTSSVVEIDCIYKEKTGVGRENHIRELFTGFLPKLKAIMVTEDETEILGEEGRLLLSDQGRMESAKRRERSMELIRNRHIYVPAWLPLLESEEEVRLRSAEATAGRAIALLGVALYSEGILYEGEGHMDEKEAFRFVQENVLDRFGAERYLSPKERAYLENPDSTEQERIHFSWQYENLFVMEWALGLIEELPFPQEICDVPLAVRVLKGFNSMEELLKGVTLRSADQILDAADLIFRLDWACVDARMNGLPAPGGMEGGITVERHKSLNWLIGFDNSADWDEVDTPT